MSKILKCRKCSSLSLKKDGNYKGQTRWSCRDCGYRSIHVAESRFSEQDDSLYNTVRSYVITSAQNATPIQSNFLKSLQNYCNHNDAQLIVTKYRYKNPSSQWSESQRNSEWWAPELVPYLLDGRKRIAKNLVVLGDIHAQATATRPLSGLHTICGEDSAILGHSKIELESIPTPHKDRSKVLTTTGSVTVENYTDTKAGAKGEHWHQYSAVVVEIDKDETFYIRHLIAGNGGSFFDLDKLYTPKEVTSGHRAEALVMGDTHAEFLDPLVKEATFGKKGIVACVEPKHLVWHDIHDFFSRNHHHRNSPFIQLAKYKAGAGNVKRALQETFDLVNECTPEDCLSIMVPSNHPAALSRWIAETDWRTDPENAEFYLETALHIARSCQMGPNGPSFDDAFTYWGKKMVSVPCVWPAQNDSYRIAEVEVGQHGDKGINGSRGSLLQYGKIGARSIIGHSHSPGIKDGAYQVGTSSYLSLGYNSGPSSWAQTHAILYANGKISLVFMSNGKFKP